MARPRVFISHGAGGDDAVWALVEAIATRLESDFQVFLDRERIHSGQRWRTSWTASSPHATAASLVTSNRSLGRPEVRREVDFLLMRAGQSPGFVVVPALADVDRAAVKAAGSAASTTSTSSAASAGGRGEAGRRRPRPGAAAHRDERELAWKARCGRRLAHAEPDALRAAAECLGQDIALWPWAVDPAGAVAQWMLECRDVAALFAATEALHAERPQVEADQIFETALPHAWIDWAAACCVRRAIDARRFVAVDSVRTETGTMYVKRTKLAPQVETLTNVAGEDDVDALVTEATHALEQLLFEVPSRRRGAQGRGRGRGPGARPSVRAAQPRRRPQGADHVPGRLAGVLRRAAAGVGARRGRRHGDAAEPGHGAREVRAAQVEGGERFARTGGGS